MQDHPPSGQSKELQKQRSVRLGKAFSDRPKRKDDKQAVKAVRSGQSIPEVITYLLMKEKFEQIYRKIQKISSKEQNRLVPIYRQTNNPQLEFPIKVTQCGNTENHSQISKQKSHQPPLKKIIQPDQSLEINTVSQIQYSSKNKGMQGSHIRRTRYRKNMLEPIIKVKMSNNIKDYLSVEKIPIKQTFQDTLAKRVSKYSTPKGSYLLGFEEKPQLSSKQLESHQSVVLNQRPKRIELSIPKKIKFKPPFQLYYYRDFIWKVAFSNEFIVEPPQQYENKLKFFVGPGNNSNLVKGIMKRRPWFTLTDKAQDAIFAWTQIKVGAYFGYQQNSSTTQKISQSDKQNLLELRKVKIQSNKQHDKGSIFNELEQKKWKQYWNKHVETERKIKQNMRNRTKFLNGVVANVKTRTQMKIHNHFLHNYIIGNKKALFKTMSQYYEKKSINVFQFLPLTFHIKKGLEDDEYLKFLQHFYSIGKDIKSNPDCIHKYNVWIVKPGQNTNRGNGITVCLQLNDIKSLLKKQQKHPDGTLKTYILQKYIERPLLYRRRKFDLRHYMMISSSNGYVKGYWYRQGYVRTTSSEYTLKFSHGAVHLTNDAVQKHLPDYGKFQKGNKLFYEELDQFIKKQDPNFDFYKQVYPKMKRIATDVIHASALSLDPQRKVNNFQIFGLDFMIDQNYDVWLIEVNTNPCLQTTCPVLARIIPRFVQNVFQTCIDPIYPAPLEHIPKYQPHLNNLNEDNQLQLVFDSRYDGALSSQTNLLEAIEDEEDVFDDDGEDFAD